MNAKRGAEVAGRFVAPAALSELFTMPAPFPHRYEADLAWVKDSEAVLSARLLPPLIGDAPPQFDGPQGRWSPELLLLSAANLCLMTTFMVIARKSKLAVASYASRAEGVLDRTREGLAFTAITLHVTLKVAPADVARAGKLLQTAKKYCIVSNALKVPVQLVASVPSPTIK